MLVSIRIRLLPFFSKAEINHVCFGGVGVGVVVGVRLGSGCGCGELPVVS